LTDKVAATFRDQRTRERDRQMANRFAAGLAKPTEHDDPEAYGLAWAALEAEKAGRLTEAASLWTQVKGQFPEEAKLPFALKDDVLAKARWGWLADKRLADLRKAAQQGEAVRRQVREKREYEVGFAGDAANPEALAARAVRLHDFGDHDKAARVWEQVAALTEKEPDKREWYLLACQGRIARGKGDDAARARPGLVAGKLAEAERIAAGIGENDPTGKKKQADIRILCREVIDLYEDEPDPAIAAAVKRARQVYDKAK
jgi:cbb3-type cytochrome oxidase subunit 3